MWNARGNGGMREGDRLVAVAIDRDKGSQYALKWAIEHIATRGQTLRLVHVKQRTPTLPPLGNNELSIRRKPDNQTMEVFLPFRCFCMRRQLECEVVVLEDPVIPRALIEYVSHYGVETLLLGATPRNGFSRIFKTSNVPSSVTKLAPDFCNVYVISKEKITTIRAATRPVPSSTLAVRIPLEPYNFNDDAESVTSPLSRGRASNNILHEELCAAPAETDFSFVSFERPSTDSTDSTDSTFLSFYENLGSEITREPSNHLKMENKSFDLNSLHKSSSIFQESTERTSWLSQNEEDMEDKMRRMELELKQTWDMYLAASREALAAKRKAREIQKWKMEEEERILEESMVAEEAALAIAEKMRAKCKAAMEAAEASQRITEIESQNRVNAEIKALEEVEEKKKLLDALENAEINTLKEAEEKKKVQDALGHSNLLLKYQCFPHLTPFIVLFLLLFLFFWN